jgi:hypothetical protein
MTKRDDGGPAFPVPKLDEDHEICGVFNGLSLRDHFAGQALAGLCANPGTSAGTDQAAFNNIAAKACYMLADAMLAARQKPRDE